MGTGFKFTSSVDPSTGAVSPTLDFGSIYTYVFNHNPKDGDNMHLRVVKSTLPYGASGVGELNFDYASPARLKKSTIDFKVDGSFVITIDGIEVADVEPASKYAHTIADTIIIMTPSAKAKAFETFTKLRAIASTQEDIKDRFLQLESMSDVALGAIIPGADPVDNRLVADEIFYRALTLDLNGKQVSK